MSRAEGRRVTARNQRTLGKARLGPKFRARKRLRVIATGRGNPVLAQQGSTTMFAGAPQRRAKTKPVGDWFIGLSCLLALVLAVVIGNAATIAVGKNPLEPDRMLAHAVSAPSKTDDYVEGLAKLGIARLPCFPAASTTRSQTCSRYAR
jgi:hypothetical protein